MISRSSAVAIATMFLVEMCSTAAAWQTTFSAGGSYSTVTGVRVGNDGNVVATGSVHGRLTTTKLDASSGAVLWRRKVSGVGLDLALDSVGNPVTIGYGSLPGIAYEFTVLKYSGSEGKLLWRHDFNGTPHAAGYAVAMSSTDDAFVSGSAANGDGTYSTLVARLAANDGAEIWQQTVVGTVANVYGRIRSLAVDASDNLIGAGGVTNAEWAIDFTVVKLDGSTGQQLWRYSVNGTADDDDSAATVVVDSNGDVIAGGSMTNAGTVQDFMVVKLSGSFGAPIWRQELSGDSDPFGRERALHLAVDDADDIYAIGRYGGSPNTIDVLKFGGTNGDVLWQTTIGDVYSSNDSPNIAVGPNGSVFVVAAVAGLAQDIVVAELDHATGTALWQRAFNGRAGFEAYEDGGVVSIDAVGNLFVGASMNDSLKPSYDFAVFKLGGAGGEDLVAGKRLDVRDGDTPSARLINFQAGGIGTSPAGDSDPTLVGATLQIRNPTSGETAVFSLPATHWRGRGKPPGARGFQYKDRDQVAGPCKVVNITPNRSIKAICKGTQIGFSLDEASQGTLAVRLTTGVEPGARVYCAEFGGEVLKDNQGRFYAKGAPAPTTCVTP